MSSIHTGKQMAVLLLVVLVFALGILACNGGTTIGGTAEATIQLLPTQPPLEPTQAPVAEPTVEPPADTPTAALTATPSIPPLGVQAGDDYLRYDYLHIVGEVVNNTDDWFEFVKVVASFYDANGTMLGTDFTYTTLDEVAPHGVGVFNLGSDVGGEAVNVTSYTLQVQGSPTLSAPYDDLAVTVTNQYESYGYYHLVGQVENTGQLDCEFVKVVGAFYDADDRVVGVDFTYTELDRVPAGGASPFDLGAGEIPEFQRFEVWVQGLVVRD